MKQIVPLARRESLIVKELADETLVYDLATGQAHCLNVTAARIWQKCDGKSTIAQLGELMEIEAESAVPEQFIWLALEQLEKFNLLESAPYERSVLAPMNRRELARSIGVAAIVLPLVLPLVMTITVPTAQAQGSSCKNRPCNVAADCCPSNPVCNSSNNKCK